MGKGVVANGTRGDKETSIKVAGGTAKGWLHQEKKAVN